MIVLNVFAPVSSSAVGGEQTDEIWGGVSGPQQQAGGRLLLFLAGWTPAAAAQSLVQRRYC